MDTLRPTIQATTINCPCPVCPADQASYLDDYSYGYNSYGEYLSNEEEESETEPEAYFLPTEVSVHNRPGDCWVSYNGQVYDLTELWAIWIGSQEIKTILAFAGKDISHWFDHDTKDIRYYVHPVTGARVPYCPHGPIPDVQASVLSGLTWQQPLDKCPWWLHPQYKKGKLTRNPRPCRIVNTLTGTRVTIMVCEEDTIKRIQERYLEFNSNAMLYTWKFEGNCLNLRLTLTQNGILDERDRFTACGLPEDYYIPSLMCYYNDKPE